MPQEFPPASETECLLRVCTTFLWQVWAELKRVPHAGKQCLFWLSLSTSCLSRRVLPSSGVDSMRPRRHSCIFPPWVNCHAPCKRLIFPHICTLCLEGKAAACNDHWLLRYRTILFYLVCQQIWDTNHLSLNTYTFVCITGHRRV